MKNTLSSASFLSLVHNITICLISEYQNQILENNLIVNTSVETLEFVAVVTRHGSRTPFSTYPNDPYPFHNRSFWPFGPEELTFFGKKQLFQTGEKLRSRYAGFLPEQFYPNDTVAEYNDFTRDFTSAALILAGLYPPVGNEIWNPNLLWHPIPMNIRHYDVCLLALGNDCPSFKAEFLKLIIKMDQEALTNKTMKELLKNISHHTGQDFKRMSELFTIYDVLQMQAENGFELPLWTKDYYPEPLRTIYGSIVTTAFAGSDFIARMSAGPELKYISEMLNNKANGTFESNRKMFIEAAHDCTIISLLGALGHRDTSLEAKTSSYIVFELHLVSQRHTVQVSYYKNSSVDNPEYINITGCSSPCSLENFTTFVDKLHFSDWNQRCHNKALNH